MAVIVCYGDSNTWGSDPASRERFGPNTRWTGVLRNALGPHHIVIEEGLGGRTTNIDDPVEEHRNGRTYLPPCLQSHAPLDLVTIMLGTNDLKARLHRNAADIAQSAVALGTLARLSGTGPGGGPPKVLIIAPPPLAKLSGHALLFDGGNAKSDKFGELYAFYANRPGLSFLDAGSIIHTSDIDGIHFEADQHALLGKAVARKIEEMLL